MQMRAYFSAHGGSFPAMLVMQVGTEGDGLDVKIEGRSLDNTCAAPCRIELWPLPRQWNTAIVRRYLSHVLAKTAGSGNIGYGKQMLELSRGRGIFVFPLQMARARNKVSSTACANYLLNCFYTTSELLGSNLTGVNNKKLLDPQIIASILEFTVNSFPGADVAMLKRALRNKITAAECRVKKKVLAQMMANS